MFFHLILLVACVYVTTSDVLTCDFKQWLNDSVITPGNAHVQWHVKLQEENGPQCSATNTNPHQRRGVLKINPPDWAQMVIVRLYHEGEICFTPWHISMSSSADGYGAFDAELHLHGSAQRLLGYGRYPGPGPQLRPPTIVVDPFSSAPEGAKIDFSVYKNPGSSWDEQRNIVNKTWPPCDRQKVEYWQQNMFRIDDMKQRATYVALNRVTNGRSDRNGAGLYYVCVAFATDTTSHLAYTDEECPTQRLPVDMPADY